MNREGHGQVQPAGYLMRLRPRELQFAKWKAETITKARGYLKSTNIWKRGLRPDAVEHGIIGEIATAGFLNLQFDSSCHPNPGGDIILKNQEQIEVKCGQMLIKTTARRCTFYAFCDRVDDERVKILGYITHAVLQRQLVVKGKGDWYNYDVDPVELESIHNLRSYVGSLR